MKDAHEVWEERKALKAHSGQASNTFEDTFENIQNPDASAL